VLSCPSGTSAIDVRRVIYNPDSNLTGASSIAGYRLLFAIGSIAAPSFQDILTSIPNPTLFAVFTEGAPEKSFTEPVRVNTGASFPGYAVRLTCFSGIITVFPTCGGSLYLIGTRSTSNPSIYRLCPL
jgi:hypothetical protein